jgi:hypothetical protein
MALDDFSATIARFRYEQARMKVLAFRETIQRVRDKASAREWVRGFGQALVRGLVFVFWRL